MATRHHKCEMATGQGNASPAYNNTSPSQPVSGNVVNPAELSRMEMQNSDCHRIGMPHSTFSEHEKVPHAAVGSQEPMTTSRRIEDHALRWIGAQFEDQQVSPNCADLIDEIISGTDRHHCHQASVHLADMSRSIVQPPRYSNLGAMQRLLLETARQQPAVVVEPSTGQLSTRGGCWHRSSPSTK